jgi:hypothetical protein
MVHQAPRDGNPVNSAVTNTWCSKDTDIGVMTVVPDTPMAQWASNA